MLSKYNEYLNDLKIRINNKLEEYIPLVYPEELYKAIRYSVLDSGKRLRAILCIESCKVFNGTEELAMPLACGIEILHAQSLIHDDLPCMDNDDYRRGKLSCHKQFGEAIAVLAGDAMIPLAFEIFIKHTSDKIELYKKAKILQNFFITAGGQALVGGQVVDVINEGVQVSPETLNYIHSNKTGALYRFALSSGAILADANENEIDVITSFADILGLAFQISDDILDITGSRENLGKTPGKDLIQNKNTYPAIYGINYSINELDRLCNMSINLLKDNKINSEILIELVNFIAKRVA